MDSLSLLAGKAVTGTVAKKAAELVVQRVQNFLARSPIEEAFNATEEAMEAHRKDIEQWASEVSFRDMAGKKHLEDVFVPLEVSLSQRRSRISVDEQRTLIGLDELLSSSTGHNIILGQPGAGKTTSMKHVCRRFLREPKFLPISQQLLLIRLRDLNIKKSKKASSSNSLLNRIGEIARIQLKFPADLLSPEDAETRNVIRDRLVIDWLERSAILLVLDGFDEIASKELRGEIIETLRELSLQLRVARLVMTTRTGDFTYHIEGFEVFEIEPLTSSQIRQLAEHWLGRRQASSLVSQIEASPFSDTALRPLTIAHLCAIYERSQKIPEKPKTVYKKVVSLLLEEWDEQRSIKRESAYANFESDRKAEFLANLAYILTVAIGRSSSFSRERLLEAYSAMRENYGLPAKDAEKVVSELESHTGLLIRAGFELFEFSHKSLQEYLAAEFIVKLPSIPGTSTLMSLPNELAIATAISSRPSDYFSEVVDKRLSRAELPFSFTRTFVTRLLLERPDFETSKRVGYSLLRLYSKYVSGFSVDAKQLEFFLHDQLSAEFGALSELIKARLDFGELVEHYEPGATAFTFDGSPVRRWVLRDDPRIRRMRLHENLPDEFWMRDFLLPPTKTKRKYKSRQLPE